MILTGYLPINLSICGGIILGYEGSPEWQSELVNIHSGFIGVTTVLEYS